jgi:ABC-type nitrate/sulfonate/bicarbonate transport system permease component
VPAILTFSVIIIFWEIFSPVILRWFFADAVASGTLQRDPSYLFPAPSAVIGSLLSNTNLWPNNVLATIQEVIIGFIIGSGVGIILGIGVSYSKTIDRVVYPLALFLRSAPLVAFAPMLTLWFGRDIWSKVVVVVIIAFFPLVVSTVVGMKSVDNSLLDLMKSISAREGMIFRKVRLPWSLPHIFSGLKIAMGTSVTAAIVAEFIGASDKGLGFMAMISMAYVDTARLFAILGILAVIGLSFFGLVTLLERYLLPWSAHRE